MTSNNYATPAKTIEAYVDACRTGDIDELKRIFHRSAIMSGHFEGEFYTGSPQFFFDEVRDNPLSPEAVSAYTAEITSEASYGKIANVTLKEIGYLSSYDLFNLFQLTWIGSERKMVSKSYCD